MKRWTNTPFLLARTSRGEVILYADDPMWYSFRFAGLFRYLTDEEFRRLHESIMAFDWRQLPAQTDQLQSETGPLPTACVTLFGAMTRQDMLELRTLISHSFLLVTALSRVHHDTN